VKLVVPVRLVVVGSRTNIMYRTARQGVSDFDLLWKCTACCTRNRVQTLSLFCARLTDGCLTTLWVKCPLSVNQ